MSKSDNNTFCIAPWMHLQVEPSGNVQLCCASNLGHQYGENMGNLSESTLEEIWNSDQYKKVRVAMMNGERLPKHCAPCYDRERSSINQTERQRFNREFTDSIPLVDITHEDGFLSQSNIKYLDIRFNNLCNLKCRTCGPEWSSSWANESGKDSALIYNDAWKKLLPHLSQLQKVYFAGGEPLITSEHYDFLEYLIKINTNVELLYTSNFTRLSLKERHVMDYWKHFSVVNAIASIDHYGEYASYVRTGSEYNTIVKNIQEIKSHGLSNVRPGVTTVYSIYNATRIGDFVIRLFEDGVIESMNQIVFNLLVNPSNQMATIMPVSALNFAIDNTESAITWLKSRGENPEKLQKALEWLVNNHSFDEEKFNTFVSYNTRLDNIRGTDFSTLYPEFYSGKN